MYSHMSRSKNMELLDFENNTFHSPIPHLDELSNIEGGEEPSIGPYDVIAAIVVLRLDV